MTLALLAANLLLFWYELSLGRQLAPFLGRWGLVPSDLVQALVGDVAHAGALITPLSAMFLHVGWLHLLRNLVYLWFFGRLVEAELGPLGLLALYLLAGMAAALAQVAATPRSTVPAVGASGAVAGLLGAYLALRGGGRIAQLGGTPELLARVLVVVWLATLALGGVLELVQPELGAGSVSWWGHLAGLVAGAILISLYQYVRIALPVGLSPDRRRRRLRQGDDG